MGIPAIPPYELPTESELPSNAVDWQPDPERAALLIHDMQRYFVAPYAEGPEPGTTMISNIKALRELADEAGMPVIYSAQPGSMNRAQRGLLHDFWGPGMSADPENREIIDELAPEPQDAVLTKWRYSAFHGTTLANVLHQQRRDQLIIVGVYAHVGCLMTACDAFTSDIQPFFVADGVADFTEEDHRMALRYVAQRCAVTMSTAQVAERISDRAPFQIVAV